MPAACPKVLRVGHHCLPHRLRAYHVSVAEGWIAPSYGFVQAVGKWLRNATASMTSMTPLASAMSRRLL